MRRAYVALNTYLAQSWYSINCIGFALRLLEGPKYLQQKGDGREGSEYE